MKIWTVWCLPLKYRKTYDILNVSIAYFSHNLLNFLPLPLLKCFSIIEFVKDFWCTLVILVMHGRIFILKCSTNKWYRLLLGIYINPKNTECNFFRLNATWLTLSVLTKLNQCRKQNNIRFRLKTGKTIFSSVKLINSTGFLPICLKKQEIASWI